MLVPIVTATTYALALALFSAALLLGVPALLFRLEPHVRGWLNDVEHWLDEEDPREPPQGPGRSGPALWPRISGPA